MSQEDIKDKVGLPPGTIIHTGADRTEKATISVMEFSKGQIREYEADCLEDCTPPPSKEITKWIHVKGVHDVDIVQRVCNYYNIHPLVIEDISVQNKFQLSSVKATFSLFKRPLLISSPL